jgi:hypothetical protein
VIPILNENSGLFSSSSHEHDLFLVYNKLDTECVKNLIGPIFRSTPYELRVAFLHDYDWSRYHRADGGSESSLSGHDVVNELVCNATFVIFIFSKNFFTNYEYGLLLQVAREKRLGIVIDSVVSDSLVRELIDPSRILKCSLDDDDESVAVSDEREVMIGRRGGGEVSACHFLFDTFVDENFVGGRAAYAAAAKTRKTRGFCK